MKKVKVQFCNYYYKAVTKEIEIPDGVSIDNEYEYAMKHFPKEEVENAPLEFEDKDLFILE